MSALVEPTPEGEALRRVEEVCAAFEECDAELRRFLESNTVFTLTNGACFITDDMTARPRLEGQLRQLRQKHDRLCYERSEALRKWAEFTK